VPSFTVRLTPAEFPSEFRERTVTVVAETARTAVDLAKARYGGLWASLIDAEVIEGAGASPEPDDR
jgi:hypothetical protein